MPQRCYWATSLALLVLVISVSCRKPSTAERPDDSDAGATVDGKLIWDEIDSALESPEDTRTAKAPAALFDAPKFELTDQSGAPFGSEQLVGNTCVVNFMFTNCTATCPKQTARLAEIQRIATRWPDGQRVRLISITVDPERDTVSRLNEYADVHRADPASWKFLTGDRESIFNIAKQGFKAPVSNDAVDSADPIMHSSRLYLVDSRQQVRGSYESGSDGDFQTLLSDMRTVLSEPTPNSDETVHIGEPAEVFAPQWLAQRRADQLATRSELQTYCDFEFVDALESSGITFVNRVVNDAGRDFKQNHYDHANGIVAADVDLDGLIDLYFLSQVGGNQLWRNRGQGKFEDITKRAGVGLDGRVSVTAAFADTDNDGDSDLYVTTTRHGNVLFENNGQGEFRDITQEAGLQYVGHSSAADFFDYDRDGRLDLYLTNVGVFTTDVIGYSGDDSTQQYPYYVGMATSFGGHLYPDQSEANILYHNEGDNRFRDVSIELGIVDNSWTGDATPMDVNEDGWIDLYVLTMQGNDEYYENIEGKRFDRKGIQVFSKAVWGGMGAKSFDYNNDGHLDLYITNMHADMWQLQKNIIGPDEKRKPPPDVMSESYLRTRENTTNVLGNGFYRNEGNGRYIEVSDELHTETYWPWGPSVGDLNADGFEDIFLPSTMNYGFRYHPNSLMLNEGGQRFRDAEFILGVEPRRDGRTATPWFELDGAGADADHRLVAGHTGKIIAWGAIGSRSAVIFDLDEDGDLDIVTNDFNSPPMVLVSNLTERHPDLRYLVIQLRGTQANRDGLGAIVNVQIGDRVLTQVHDGQSGYLSQSSIPLYFGLGDAQSVDKITIRWPGGEQQIIEGPVATNQRLLCVQSTSNAFGAATTAGE